MGALKLRIAQLIRLLGSDRDGEVVNAVRALERALRQHDRDFHWLAELADLCGISQGHLARTFKESTGWQIHKYIAEERLKAAKSMLADDHLSCEAIAAQLGFKSQAYFSTAFRRMTGKTPSEYRDQLFAAGG